ncbi:MAG: DUF4197 domain-containing protein [Bacteroidetes bacterium]|nr:DUF4197 domain-containing protein [Bacteroidota bacterium]
MKNTCLMKKFLLLAFLLSSLFSKAQIDINNILNTVNNSLGSGLSNADITKGLKEALNVGSKNASTKASKTDGFYKNNLIKIPFPSDARDMRSTLVNLGMKRQVEEFEKQLNRAAEDAAKKAAPIFLSAITSMTINDGLTILKGKDDEATQYLRKSTTAQLSKEFRPVIAASLKKVQITKYWNPLFSTYNKVPFVKKVNPSLDDFVTQRAIEGLFKLVAIEETKIRKDPAARVSDILKKVFGGK